MMRKVLYSILAVAIIALLVLGAWMLFARKRPQAPSTLAQDISERVGETSITSDAKSQATVTSELAAEVKEASKVVPPAPAANAQEIALGKLASSFVERMGTYSSASNFSNLKELYPLMSSSLQAWADGVIAKGQDTPAGFSLRTIALSAKREKGEDAARAVYRITAQRERTEGDKKQVVYQKAIATLVLSGENWLVDSVTWQEEGAL